MDALEVQNATKRYGNTYALKGISIGIDRGSFLSVVGPSGSGKTTLLRLLDLLEKPTEGRIVIDGVDTSEITETKRLDLRRQMGMVFQHNVMLNRTVYENVAYPLRVRRAKDGLTKKVSDSLERVGLSGYESRKAIRLSGGEIQRVALAQALVYKPKILLLDEPTANLDPRNASVIENIVLQANREDRVTTVMSTHNPLQAQHSASKVLILRLGTVAEFDDASTVFNKPSTFLSSFMETGNTYPGISKPTASGFALIDLGNGIQIQGVTEQAGNVMASVDPQNITVTPSKVTTSGTNSLKGTIIAIIDHGGQVQLELNCGQKFIAKLTKSSFKELNMGIEAQAYVNFKASDVMTSRLRSSSQN
ncbi:MAG TPA: ATP-binding cassette domain-containing protein [Terriglobales bacterium]|nr:ATP-binding cassette domain-containing protein [Terriglobales bacterium]